MQLCIQANPYLTILDHHFVAVCVTGVFILPYFVKLGRKLYHSFGGGSGELIIPDTRAAIETAEAANEGLQEIGTPPRVM